MTATGPVVSDGKTARGTFHTLGVASVERLCDDAVAVTFDVPEDLRAAYDFEAGQSLTLRRVIDGEGVEAASRRARGDHLGGAHQISFTCSNGSRHDVQR